MKKGDIMGYKYIHLDYVFTRIRNLINYSKQTNTVTLADIYKPSYAEIVTYVINKLEDKNMFIYSMDMLTECGKDLFFNSFFTYYVAATLLRVSGEIKQVKLSSVLRKSISTPEEMIELDNFQGLLLLYEERSSNNVEIPKYVDYLHSISGLLQIRSGKGFPTIFISKGYGKLYNNPRDDNYCYIDFKFLKNDGAIDLSDIKQSIDKKKNMSNDDVRDLLIEHEKEVRYEISQIHPAYYVNFDKSKRIIDIDAYAMCTHEEVLNFYKNQDKILQEQKQLREQQLQEDILKGIDTENGRRAVESVISKIY
jgi:hypothetical protein